MNPQAENGHVDIAHEIMEQLYKTNFTALEFRVIFYVIRKTWGWHVKSEKISYAEIANGIGIARRNAMRIVNALVSRRTLVRTKGTVNTLQFNKKYTEWLVSPMTPPGVTHDTTPGVTHDTTPGVTHDTTEIYKETNKETNKEIVTNVTREFGNSQINELQSYFLAVMQIPKEDCPQQLSRRYWYNLLRDSKTGVLGVKWLIETAKKDQFYGSNITSSKDLYYKRMKLMTRARGSVPKISIMPGDMNQGGDHVATDYRN